MEVLLGLWKEKFEELWSVKSREVWLQLRQQFNEVSGDSARTLVEIKGKIHNSTGEQQRT